MKGEKAVSTKAKYLECEPDVTSTGIGKSYERCRIFFSWKTGVLELIENDYSIRAPTLAEAERFRKDLSAAAKKDRKVADAIEKFPVLANGEDGPLVEGPAKGPEPEGAR